jgi:hypothetical protein
MRRLANQYMTLMTIYIRKLPNWQSHQTIVKPSCCPAFRFESTGVDGAATDLHCLEKSAVLFINSASLGLDGKVPYTSNQKFLLVFHYSSMVLHC